MPEVGRNWRTRTNTIRTRDESQQQHESQTKLLSEYPRRIQKIKLLRPCWDLISSLIFLHRVCIKPTTRLCSPACNNGVRALRAHSSAVPVAPLQYSRCIPRFDQGLCSGLRRRKIFRATPMVERSTMHQTHQFSRYNCLIITKTRYVEMARRS